MFAVWFMARKLSPDMIVESGIWKGQSTWLLEKACPEAQLVSIDLNLDYREYVSPRAIYSRTDFSRNDWSHVTEKSLVLFDDHQNAYNRLLQCKWFGFKHVIFDDNYPASHGDCYSLKKAFAQSGFQPERFHQKGTIYNVLRKVARRLGKNSIDLQMQHENDSVEPNDIDSKMLHTNLDIYYEFPPILKINTTRWGDNWDSVSYPTPEPLLLKSTQRIFLDEAMYYTWICYARLK